MSALGPSEKRRVEIRLPAELIDLSGRVVDPAGALLVGADVRVSRAGTDKSHTRAE